MKLLEIEYLTNVKVRGTIEVSDEDYEDLKDCEMLPGLISEAFINSQGIPVNCFDKISQINNKDNIIEFGNYAEDVKFKEV